MGSIRALDDLHIDVTQDPPESVAELWPLIAAIGIELEQEGIQAEQGRHHQDTAVAVLNVSRMHDGVQQQTLGVYKDMALLAFDPLAAVIPMRVDAGPPFSALLTLWLSMIAAVGLASRPANSRHFT